MLPYWLMYAFPAMLTMVIGATDPQEQRRARVGLAFVLVAFTVLIGLRYEVGTDWFNYQRTLDDIYYMSFAGTVGYKDPGFGVIVWISSHSGWGVYGANLFCGAVLMFGLWRFARRQPDTWLAVTAAVPYLVIVVGMGYVRQSAAIGFLLLAILKFEDQRYLGFLMLVVAAGLFHGTSICILPLITIVLLRDRRDLIIPSAVLGAILFALLLEHRISTFYSTYIDAEYSSSGALIRLVMNAVPSALFLAFRKRFTGDRRVELLWLLFSGVAILMLLVFPVFPSSTALDRFGLYFIPIQIFVFGRLPLVFGETARGARIVSYGVILYYGAVLFIWLVFASNAHAWLPYRFAPLVRN